MLTLPVLVSPGESLSLDHHGPMENAKIHMLLGQEMVIMQPLTR